MEKQSRFGYDWDIKEPYSHDNGFGRSISVGSQVPDLELSRRAGGKNF